jgi:competence protein ComEA
MVRNTWVAAALMAALVMGMGVRELEAAQGQTAKPAPTAEAPLDLNTATSADLQKLPGIGPALADRIIEYRQKNGSFKKVEELMNVQGIGEKSFLRLKPLVSVIPPKTAER